MTQKTIPKSRKPPSKTEPVLSKFLQEAEKKTQANKFSRIFFRRRKFIINKKMQLSLLMLSVGYIIFFCFVMACALFIPLIIQLNSAYTMSQDARDSATQILYLHDKFWFAALLALIVVGLHSILTSHRIAGPLYRFEQVFKSITEGRLPKWFNLRKGDFLQKEKETINNMVTSLRTRVEEVQATGEALRDAARAIEEPETDAFGEDFSSKLDRLEEKTKEFRDSLALLLKE